MKDEIKSLKQDCDEAIDNLVTAIMNAHGSDGTFKVNHSYEINEEMQADLISALKTQVFK